MKRKFAFTKYADSDIALSQSWSFWFNSKNDLFRVQNPLPSVLVGHWALRPVRAFCSSCAVHNTFRCAGSVCDEFCTDCFGRCVRVTGCALPWIPAPAPLSRAPHTCCHATSCVPRKLVFASCGEMRSPAAQRLRFLSELFSEIGEPLYVH